MHSLRVSASMDSACRFIAAPGAPLHPISPERANQQKHLRPEISLSPSLPNIAGFSQVGISSDVQGKVAQFNSLDIKDVTERRKEREAALRRAVLGREEAENETRKAREEIGALTRELEEYKQREKRVSKRLEQAMVWIYHSSSGISSANPTAGGITSLQRGIAADQREIASIQRQIAAVERNTFVLSEHV